MKNIRLTKHALEQCDERGATEAEIKKAINDPIEKVHLKKLSHNI